MHLYPRSFWTSIIPKSSIVGDSPVGLPYFTSSPDVEFYVPDKELLYIYRNPSNVLNQMVKNPVGISDIDYNYALAQNTLGAYTLRGRLSKCSKSDKLKVLLLVGRNEKYTDVLKKNVNDFALGGLVPTPPGTTMRPGDASVHVFDLIEYLGYRGLYEGRNDGIYGPFVTRAVQKLQLELDLPNLDGVYNEWVTTKLLKEQNEYIRYTVTN